MKLSSAILTASATGPFTQLKPLTSIRFIFALLVVLFHGLPESTGRLDLWPQFMASVISHGFVGVSFFFVLSGFILAYSYSGRMRDSNEQASFWWARAARILPAYFLAFLVYLPFAVYGVLTAEQPKGAAMKALTIASFQLTLTQAWIPQAALQWNSPAWSLSVEAFFYLIFPFLFVRIEALSIRALWVLAVLAYAASQALALAIWWVGPGNVASGLNSASGLPPLTTEASTLFFMYFPIMRTPEFIFGAAIGMIFVRCPPLTENWRRICLWLGAAGFALAFPRLDGHVPPPEISNGVLMPLLGLVLFGLAYSKSQLWANPYFVRLGDASYSMYLLHIPLFQWLGAIDKRVLDLQDRHFVSFFILYLSAVIGASLLSLKYVEEPSRIVIRRCFSQKRAPLAVNARDRAGV